MYIAGSAVLSRAAPPQASVEKSRSQGSAVSQGATSESDIPINVPEMSEKGILVFKSLCEHNKNNYLGCIHTECRLLWLRLFSLMFVAAECE